MFNQQKIILINSMCHLIISYKILFSYSDEQSVIHSCGKVFAIYRFIYVFSSLSFIFIVFFPHSNRTQKNAKRFTMMVMMIRKRYKFTPKWNNKLVNLYRGMIILLHFHYMATNCLTLMCMSKIQNSLKE